MTFNAKVTGMDEFNRKMDELRDELRLSAIQQINDNISSEDIDKYHIATLYNPEKKKLYIKSDPLPDRIKEVLIAILGIDYDKEPDI